MRSEVSLLVRKVNRKRFSDQDLFVINVCHLEYSFPVVVLFRKNCIAGSRNAYAADKKISRSAAIESAITGLIALNDPIVTVENNLGQSDSCIFASPSLGAAILY